MEIGFYAVNGKLSDCVQLGINCFLEEAPDLVISGINHGANLCDDTIYSGTVAAALEGRHMGLPSVDVSLCSKQALHFETAAVMTCKIIDKLKLHPLSNSEILNLN
jgi:5'-nucleotidase